MNIWRINCKPGETRDHKDQFDFWIEKGFVGIGWSSAEGFTDDYIGDEENYEELKLHIKEKWKNMGKHVATFSSASNVVVNRMQIGDFVWVRYSGDYRLGKIKSNCLYNFNSKSFDVKRQIGFYREVEYLGKEFKESAVPGKVVASYRSRSTVQAVSDNENTIVNYCQSIWEGNEYKIKFEDWSKFFHSSDIEEIIGLYLQIEKKLYVYTSTNKKDTPLIEFELVDKNGISYGVQVKSGNTPIDVKTFSDIAEKMRIYLFATSNNYINSSEVKNVDIIERDNIDKFIEKYIDLLPERIKFWLRVDQKK